MNVRIQPLSEVTDRAKTLLFKELGVADTLRFLGQFRAGSGDYTQDREKLFEGETVESILTAIKSRRGSRAM